MPETWCYWHFLCLFASSRLIALCTPNCKSLWIKASAKWLNVNVNVNVYTLLIAPLKPQHVENTTVQWKSAGDEFTFYKKWGGHVPRVIYAPDPIIWYLVCKYKSRITIHPDKMKIIVILCVKLKHAYRMGQPVSNMKIKSAFFVSLRACSLHVFPQNIPHYLKTVKAKPAVMWLLIPQEAPTEIK